MFLEGFMTIKKMKYFIVFIMLVGFVILSAGTLHAEDELSLTGVVKSLNIKTKTVIINVKSTSCIGLKTFAVDNADDFQDLVDQKITFSINSSTCKRNETYRITRWRVTR